MSKVEKLKEKYPITTQSFSVFYEADETPTKKYLEYFLKMWMTEKNKIGTMSNIIEMVKKFDELLPYIPLKDIYHFEYSNYHFLEGMVEMAEYVKDEKTFIREDHCELLIENDEYLFLSPKTVRGSLKYGANTKWCTASKNNPKTFEKYIKDGVLCYLIDKTKNKDDNYDKIAFYIDYKVSPLNGEVLIFDGKDNSIDALSMVKNGWDEDEVFLIVSTFRYFANQMRKKTDAKKYLIKLDEVIKKINLDEIKSAVNTLNSSNSLIDELKSTINKLDNKIKKII